MSNNDENDGGEDSDSYNYKLPSTVDFDGVNRNFDDVGSAITLIIQEMRENSEVTNANLTRLAEETAENISKLTSDMKAVLGSQTMMLSMCVIVIGFLIIMFKAIYDVIFGPIV